MNFPPDKLTINGAANLFQMDRHRLGAWRETDSRFPEADERGRYATIQLCAYLELRRYESMTDHEIETESRESRAAMLALDFLSQAARKRLLACPLPDRAERVADYMETISGPTVGGAQIEDPK